MTTITKNTPIGKGLRTTFQAIIGTLIGLVVVVWAVPGVPAAVLHYIATNAVAIVAGIGIPSGAISFVMNWLEDRKATQAQ